MGFSWGVDVNQRPGGVRPLWAPRQRATDRRPARVWPFALLVAILAAVSWLLITGDEPATDDGGAHITRPSLRVTPMGRLPVVPVQVVRVAGAA